MTKGSRVAPFLATKLRALDEQLAATLPRVLASQDDEAIHDMRVAIRRLRTILRLARPVYGRFHADAVRGAFTAVQRATGALRDEEVLAETLADVRVTDPHFVAWRARRRARERALRRQVIAHLQSGELARARTMLAAIVALPVRHDRDADLTKFARRAVESARKVVEHQRDCPTSDAEGLHELRIAYKNLRYAAETMADGLPADLAAMAKPAAHFQKRLGEIHDIDVALATVDRARGLPPRVSGRVRRALSGVRVERIRRYVADMAPTPPAPAEIVHAPNAPSPEADGGSEARDDAQSGDARGGDQDATLTPSEASGSETPRPS